MGGNWINDDTEKTTPSLVRTLVLVGRTGNGKSATGNSILGFKAFKSMPSSNGVTSNCELQRTVSEDDLVLNVIDTPGLFDFSGDVEFVGREIARCIDLAKDGIDAFLLVLSVRSRFTREQEATIMSLQEIFGNKMMDYTVVVFTGGDDLEYDGNTLEDYLCNCPEELKKILEICRNRKVLFDNKTRDESKRAEQVKQLLLLVNQVMQNSGRKPYTNDLFTELKKGAMELHDQAAKVNSLEGYSKEEILELEETIHKPYDEQMNEIAKMVEARLKETTARLEQQLAEEQAARLRAEASAKEAKRKSKEVLRKKKEMEMRMENIERARRENEALRSRLHNNNCAIL